LLISPDRNKLKYRRSENDRANCDHSRTYLPNFVNFGPQTAKMGQEFRPTQKQLFRTFISQG